ncbi:MAG: sigma-70 family RNA polymerase sigma factor [Myxococcales bacterium]|nr:sigma-70 family RNA polymerase sigma factor [Myxococcales bacterium]MCB9643101.1 sigma-70 family RNA polymerase sigma factor [Myxococcales bacterium]
MSGEHSDQLWTDEELVSRLLAKDEEAFNIFYDRYAPGLVRRLYRLTGDMVKAKDALQQTMLEVLSSLPSYKGKGALGAWVNRIATFVVIDRFRQEGRQKGFLDRWAIHLTSLQERPSPLPHEMLEDESIRTLVREQLEFLSARKRVAVLLCDLEGLSLEEASEQMGVPIGTVSSRLHHGRRELRQRIKNELKRRGLSVEDLLHG